MNWTIVPYEYGLELHCPTCHTVTYLDAATIDLDDLTAAADAHHCTVDGVARTPPVF